MAEFNPNFLKNADVGWTGTNGRYFPPDFDHTKIIPQKQLKGKQGPRQMNMRMIMPFSMYCEGCGECMYVGTKFNSKCEPVKGEDHLGIKIYRFYGRCKNCMHEFIFKTDPKTSDYVLESGGSRSYEAYKDADDADANIRDKIEKEKAEDKMKELEHKTYDIQEEMKRMDQLDDLMKLNRRMKSNSAGNDVIAEWRKLQSSPGPGPSPGSEELDDDEMAELDAFLSEKEKKEEVKAPGAQLKFGAPAGEPAPPAKAKRPGALIVRKRPREESKAGVAAAGAGAEKAEKVAKPAAPEPPAAGGLGLGNYDSDESQ